MPLDPPDRETNAQACLAGTQTPSGRESEEIEEIARDFMAPGEVKAIRTTESMVILRAKGRSSRNLIIRSASYDNVQQRTILPI